MSEITLTFPDGAKRSVRKGITGKELAESISKSLAKRAVAMVVDGKLADLADPIKADATVKIVSRTDPEALELIRHDAAHVMAEAVQALWPGTQVTIGPVIENGFFYDFAKAEPFHPDDLAKIEAKMHEIIARNAPFTKEFWSREQAKDFFRKKGELFKIELVDAIPAGEDLKIYKQGEWLDLCRGPHMTSTGQIGKAFKLTKFAGSYWRGDHTQAAAAAHLRHRLGDRAGAGDLSQADRGSREARPSQARARDGSLPLPGGGARRRLLAPEGLGAVPGPHQLHAPPAERGRLSRGEQPADPRQVAVGDLGPLGVVPREHVHHRDRGRARVRHQADELPGPRADLQARAALLSRAALPHRRVRHRAPLRAVGRAARAHARARLHPGRRARLLHRGAARRRVPEDQRPDPVDLSRLRLRGGGGQALDPAREARRLRRAVGPGRGGHVARAEADRGTRRATRSRPAINPGEGAFYGPKFEYVLRDAIGRDWQCGTTRSTSTCRSASAPSTSTPTARRRRR